MPPPTVNPIKLETGLRPNSAGIPYTLLLRIEAMVEGPINHSVSGLGFYSDKSGDPKTDESHIPKTVSLGFRV